MKRRVLPVLAGIILLASCASTSGTSGSSAQKTASSNDVSRLEYIVQSMKSADPAKGDVWMMNVNESPEKTYTSTPFYAASIFMMLDERLNLSSVMTDSQKIAFTKALAADLEDGQDNKDVRAVVIGKYFSELKEMNNLYIIISKVSLKPGAIPDANSAYRFVTNAMLTHNKETGEIKAVSTGFMMNPTMNFSFFAIPFENGVLVTGGNLNLNKQNYSSNLSLAEKGNLMDVFAKDEIAENDVQIETIYKEINGLKDKDLGDTDIIVKYVLAPLNYGLYLAKLGKTEEAKKIWNSISLSKIPVKTAEQKNTVDSMKIIFERDIPNCLLITSEF